MKQNQKSPAIFFLKKLDELSNIGIKQDVIGLEDKRGIWQSWGWEDSNEKVKLNNNFTFFFSIKIKIWVYLLVSFYLGSPGGIALKNLPAKQEMQVWSLGQEDALEKETATLSNILVWRIPRTEEPGRLQSMGLQRVGHDSVTKQQQQQAFYLV